MGPVKGPCVVLGVTRQRWGRISYRRSRFLSILGRPSRAIYNCILVVRIAGHMDDLRTTGTTERSNHCNRQYNSENKGLITLQETGSPLIVISQTTVVVV